MKNIARLTGLNQKQFDILLEKLKEYIENNCTKRGRKSSFNLEQRLLLTLRYLRSYPTFLELGREFGISDSFAYKIFTRISKILVKILALPNLNQLKDIGTLLIDVTEQPTERPKKNNN